MAEPETTPKPDEPKRPEPLDIPGSRPAPEDLHDYRPPSKEDLERNLPRHGNTQR
jgi:hypothetical protein